MAAYASTFTTIQTAVIAKGKLDATADATRAGEWINQVYAEIAAETRWFEGSSAGSALSAAATSQALPATIVQLEFVTCSYGGQVTYLRPIGFERMLMLRTSTGTGPPVYYSLRKSTVELFPGAAGGEVLTYWGATLPDTISGSDPPLLPEPFAAKLLEYGALLEAADYKRDPQLFAQYEPMYSRWRAAFQMFVNRRKTQGSQEVPVLGPDGRPFGVPYLPTDPSSDFYVTGWRG